MRCSAVTCATRTQRKGPPSELGDRDWPTPDQVAQRLGVTGTAVRFRAARGTIPRVRHSKRIWICADHLEVLRRARGGVASPEDLDVLGRDVGDVGLVKGEDVPA